MRSIIIQKNFEKSYIKLSGKAKELFKKRRDLFLEDPRNPLLGIHILHGDYDGYKREERADCGRIQNYALLHWIAAPSGLAMTEV